MKREVSAESSDPRSPSFLSGLFGAEVHVLASPFQDCTDDLSPSERELVRGVVKKRELEFVTGRMLARRLLAEVGHAGVELLRDPDRVPIWPDDVVGSISHTHLTSSTKIDWSDHEGGRWQDVSLCVVALAPRRDRTGVGVDVEPDEPVSPELESRICNPVEQAWLESGGFDQIGRRCRMVFSVKEAVYKAFFPQVREVWGFHEVEVEIDLSANAFLARLPRSAGRADVEGRILRRGGWILSGVDYV